MSALRSQYIAAVLALPLALAGLGGCAESYYVFRPTEHDTARLADSGLPAALHAIPPDAPQGELLVAALGLYDFADDDEGRHVVLRLVVRNESPAPWHVELARQVVTFPSGATREPDPPEGSVERAEHEHWIAPRAERAIDLAYPVPDGERLTWFQLAWTVSTPTEEVTGRTGFRREDPEPTYLYGHPPYPYWHEPYYSFYPRGYWLGPLGPTVILRPRPTYHPHFVQPPPPAPHRPAPATTPAPAPAPNRGGHVVPAPPPGRR